MKRRVQGTLAVGALAGATAALIVASPAGAGVERATATAKTYPNCEALNRVYPHGVGRIGARDRVRGSSDPVRNFKRSNLLYRQNSARDRDKDGVACEKR
jgi:Excalibur calcium-binding domain